MKIQDFYNTIINKFYFQAPKSKNFKSLHSKIYNQSKISIIINKNFYDIFHSLFLKKYIEEKYCIETIIFDKNNFNIDIQESFIIDFSNSFIGYKNVYNLESGNIFFDFIKILDKNIISKYNSLIYFPIILKEDLKNTYYKQKILDLLKNINNNLAPFFIMKIFQNKNIVEYSDIINFLYSLKIESFSTEEIIFKIENSEIEITNQFQKFIKSQNIEENIVLDLTDEKIKKDLEIKNIYDLKWKFLEYFLKNYKKIFFKLYPFGNNNLPPIIKFPFIPKENFINNKYCYYNFINFIITENSNFNLKYLIGYIKIENDEINFIIL